MTDLHPEYKQVVAYIRKSSEDNEQGEAHKQLNSIEYQRQFVKDASQKYDLKGPIRIFEDDKTGYEAFVREGFEEMLVYLKDHKDNIDGIICTEISRLARNFADGGMILWYMQSGIIKRIYTPSKIFSNSSSDQLMVAIEFAMSKKSSDDTGYRTKEGMRNKVRTMKHPARPAILGYITRGPVGRKEWIIDPVKGPLVKIVFEQFATGKFTFDQIADYAYNIGLKTNKKSNLHGKISKNTWRNRLTDIQYTGIFYEEGERIAGEYEPLINTELFYSVQTIISDHHHPKETHLDYAYSRIVHCGLCNGMLSGTHKKGITYYRCGKRKLPCKNIDRITYIPEKKLEDKLMSAFEKIEIDEDAWKASREYVAEINQPHKIDIKKQVRALGEQVTAEEKLQIKIGRKFSLGELDRNEHDRLLKDSQLKIASLRNTIVKSEHIVDELDALMYQFLDNIKYVTKRLRLALPENKREMVSIFCENLVWKDNKLHWDWKKPYFFLVKQPAGSNMLPLKDLFCNQELEFGITLSDLKIAFENLGLQQPRFAIA